MKPILSVVMPCLNEELTLETCIKKAQKSFADMDIEGEVIIADNGSTDSSVEIALSLGARVVHQPVKGYGAALYKGFEAAEGEIIIMADSDDSYDWSNIRPFVEKINEGYDLVMGNRFKGGIEPGAMPFLHKYLGNPVLSTISRIVYRVPVRDFHCGMRAFTKQAFMKMNLRTTGMEFATEMVANSAMQGLKIAEVPTKLYPDGRNRPPHLRSFRDGWRHLRFIFTYAPDYLYMLPSFMMLLAGALLIGFLAWGPMVWNGHYFGIHFLALGCLLSLAGFNIFSFGLIAKLILAKQLPGIDSVLVRWAKTAFSLEKGVVVSLILLLSGLGIDIELLRWWIATAGGDMESTVHLGFVATTLIILGLNMLLSAFILNMLLLHSCDEDDFLSSKK